MKLLLYCCKEKNKYDRLVPDEHYGKKFFLYGPITENFESINGKIVAECDFEVEEIKLEEYDDYNYSIYSTTYYETKTLQEDDLCKQSCLTADELDDYLKGENGYAIHIKNLHIFDKPKELRECTRYNPERNSMWGWLYDEYFSIKNAPQNMMTVYDSDEKKVLISIRPEWLCKILNEEKTIEVRKKVLKEMQQCPLKK